MILLIRHEFRLLDGSDVPALSDSEVLSERNILSRYEEIPDIDLEYLLPPLPSSLDFQDLSLYGINWERLMALKDWQSAEGDIPVHGPSNVKMMIPASSYYIRKAGFSPSIWKSPHLREETMEVVLPDDMWTLRYPASDHTFRCYDCLRPLNLFKFIQYDSKFYFRGDTYPRGYCTQHLIERSLPSLFRSSGDKNFDKFKAGWIGQRLNEWKEELKEAWNSEKNKETPRYMRWKEETLRQLRNKRAV